MITLTEAQFDALVELIKAEAYAAARESHGGYISTDSEHDAAYALLVNPLEETK